MANKTNKKNKAKYTEVEKFAYQLGLVKRGLKSPQSRITDSFNKGVNSKKEKAPKKSLFGD